MEYCVIELTSHVQAKAFLLLDGMTRISSSLRWGDGQRSIICPVSLPQDPSCGCKPPLNIINLASGPKSPSFCSSQSGTRFLWIVGLRRLCGPVWHLLRSLISLDPQFHWAFTFVFKPCGFISVHRLLRCGSLTEPASGWCGILEREWCLRELTFRLPLLR